MQTAKKVNRGGRPRKFQESSRPITITLPDRTLNLLTSVDSDRAQAIVKATDWATRTNHKKAKPVEVVEVQKGYALIVVGPSQCLRRIPWLQLAEIAPARFLLVIPSGTPVETLEVSILDMLDGLTDDEEYERLLLNDLRQCLIKQRRNQKMSKAELLLIDTSIGPGPSLTN